MDIAEIVGDGLCTQCGTCAGLCPERAIDMIWSVRNGWVPAVGATCTGCGVCLRSCPGAGFDFTPGARWRERNNAAPAPDFLGPYRGLWFGWAADPAIRYAGASGGAATAVLQGALEAGTIEAAIVVRMSRGEALAAEATLASTADEIAAAHGSKYTTVPVNTLLHDVIARPGRYALVGLPCHIQGLRLAQRHNAALRERVVLALGIFCGWTSLPRGTDVVARRAGVPAGQLAAVRYRGPGWPGGMRLETRGGQARECAYPDYFDDCMLAWTPTRCRICPDALAEAADISVGDAWLDRFTGQPGVSDLIARTPAGERLVAALAGERLVLETTTPREMIASQSATYGWKRDVFRGRLWLRRLAGRRAPDYPGVATAASPADKLAGVRSLASELWYRAVSDVAWPE